MELGVIIAITGSSVAIIGVVISMMFWCRQESNSLRQDAKEDRREFMQISRDIQMEMKDFHHQLLEIQKERAGRRDLV